MQAFGPATPSRDALIAETVPTANFGSRTTGRASWAFSGQRAMTLLAWPASSIATRSRVLSAPLKLVTQSTTLTVPQACRVYVLTRLFTEGTENGGTTNTGVTFYKYNSAAEGGNNWTTAGGDFDPTVYAEFWSPITVSPVFVELRDVIQHALDHHRINGFISLIVVQHSLLNENKIWDPYLREHGTAANRPQLTVYFEPPPTLATRRPTISLRRRHDVEPRLSVAFYSDLTRAANGDGLPGAGTVDYATALASVLPLWPFGQRSMFGGGFCRHPYARPAANPTAGHGFAGGGFAGGGYCIPTPPLTWRVPFALRDGDYVFGARLADRLGNVATTPAMETAFSIAAIPRAPGEARFEEYDAGTKFMGIAWNASPDVEEV